MLTREHCEFNLDGGEIIGANVLAYSILSFSELTHDRSCSRESHSRIPFLLKIRNPSLATLPQGNHSQSVVSHVR